MKIDVKIEGIEGLLRDLDPQLQTKVVVSTVNELASNARATAKRRIRSVYNIKARDIDIRIKKANRTNAYAVLTIPTARTPLIKFGARWKSYRTPIGASVMVRKGNRKKIRGAFIATMPSGHTGVYRRDGSGSLPIDELESLSVGKMFLMYEPEIQRYLNRRFEKVFFRNLSYHMRTK